MSIIILCFIFIIYNVNADYNNNNNNNKIPLTIINKTIALSRGAVCLDGSPPGFYFRPSLSKHNNNKKWVIFFKGGGWCEDVKGCFERSKTELGSSTKFPLYFGLGGPIDPNESNNPTFFSYNHVILWYCDGASFSGNNNNKEIFVNNKTGTTSKLYFRGFRILNVLFDILLKPPYNLNMATDVLLTGGSAGGLAAYLHADYIKNEKLPFVSNFRVAPISGFFPLHDNADGQPFFGSYMKKVFNLHQSKDGINQKCIRSFNDSNNDETWKCMFANYTLGFTSSDIPFFPIQSIYDSVQLAFILNSTELNKFGCLLRIYPQFAECTEKQITLLNIFAKDVLHDIQVQFLNKSYNSKNNNDGGFIENCYEHVQGQGSLGFNGYRLNNITMNVALSKWWYGDNNNNNNNDNNSGTRNNPFFHWPIFLNLTAPIQPSLSCNVAPPDPIDFVLTASTFTLAIDSKFGSITSVRDTLSSIEFVDKNSIIPLFEVVLSGCNPNKMKRNNQSNHILINASGFTDISVYMNNKYNLIISEFKHHPVEPSLICNTSFIVEDSLKKTDKVRSNINCYYYDNEKQIKIITKKSKHIITCPVIKTISFPNFHQQYDLGNGDSIVAPWYEGVVVQNPGLQPTWYYNSTMLKASPPKSNGEFFPWTMYPGFASFQFMSRYCSDTGLYIATDDIDGHVKQFDANGVQNEHVQFILQHLKPEIPLEPFQLPYDVVITTFAPKVPVLNDQTSVKLNTLGNDWGGWRQAANIYKDWVITNKVPWIETELKNRKDIPSYLMEGMAAVVLNICNPPETCEAKGYNSMEFGKNLENLAPMLHGYKKVSGLDRVLGIVYGWEHLGVWAGIGYLPPKPNMNAWLTASNALKMQNDRAGVLVSGFWMVKERPATRYGPAFDQEIEFNDIRDALVMQADGTLAQMDYRNETNGAHHGLSYRLCHHAEKSQNKIFDIFTKSLPFATVISFDQEMGGAADFPCYNASHGHPPGRGKWEWEGYRDTLIKIRKYAIKNNQEFALMQEQSSELAIPFLGLTWSRQFWQIASQGATFDVAGMSNTLNVGVFSYLYHEYSLALAAAQYQGQGSKVDDEPYQLRTYVIFSGIVRGLMPSPFANDVNSTKDEWHINIKKVNNVANNIWKNYATTFLSTGQIVMPPSTIGNIKCNAILKTYELVNDNNNGSLVRRYLNLPALHAGSFIIENVENNNELTTISTVLINNLWNSTICHITLPWIVVIDNEEEENVFVELYNGEDRNTLVQKWPINTRIFDIEFKGLDSFVLIVPNVKLCERRPCLN